MVRNPLCCAVGLFAAACAARPAQHAAGPLFAGFRVVEYEAPPETPGPRLTVALWYPTDARPARHLYGGPTVGFVAEGAEPAAGRHPLLLFSHGFLGCGLGYAYLAEALAERGWIVAAPDHHDVVSALRNRGGRAVRPREFRALEGFRAARRIARTASPKARREHLFRPRELAAVLRALLADPVFGPRIDRGRIAAGGHSFGGFTALALCGPLPELRVPEIRAVLVLSSGASGYLFSAEELARVSVPSFLLFGELELERRPGWRTDEAFIERLHRALAPPTHLAILRKAHHFSFNEALREGSVAKVFSSTPALHATVAKLAIAFLEHYVLEKGAGPFRVPEDPNLVRAASRLAPARRLVRRR